MNESQQIMFRNKSVLFRCVCFLLLLFTSYISYGSVVVTVTNGIVVCKGGTGDIVVTASGGVGPYTFLLYDKPLYPISNNAALLDTKTGDTGCTFSGLTPSSTYYILVYDSSIPAVPGGSGASISEPSEALSGSATTVATTCSNSSDGKMTVTTKSGSGWPGYTYNIDGGIFQAASSFGSLTSGDHTVIVKDSQGCTVSVTATISAPAAVMPNITATNVKCNGNTDGTLTINSVSGGTAPYTYKVIKSGGTGSFSNKTSYTGLAAGDYIVTVQSVNGCYSDPVTVTITQPAAMSLVLQVLNNVSCYDSYDATLRADVSGGTAPYTYSWTKNGSLSGTGNLFSGFGVGECVAFDAITDANGCPLSSQSFCYGMGLPAVVGEVIPSPIVIDPDPAAHMDACQGQSNGTITVVATGGTGTLNYSLDAGGAGVYLPSGAFTGKAAGTYPIWVKDANSCKVQGKDVTIGSLNLPSPTINGSLTVCAGSTNNSYVTESGNSNYQWTVVGGTITSGAGTNTINVTWNTTGTQSVSVNYTNAQGCSAVSPIKVNVTVNAATSITTQPVSVTVCSGTSAGFSVVAAGTGTLTYQWKKNGTDIPGATSATYNIPSVNSGDAGSYTVVVTGTCGSVTSNAATLTVNAATSITTQPVTQSVCLGASATFSVVAAGTGTLTYQWKKDGTDIPGATSATYNIPSVNNGDAGSYTVVVIGACGNVTSSAAPLTVNPVTSITTQPVSQTICTGSPVTFSVVAAGVGLTYQWKKDGANISGATSASYTIPLVAGSDAGSYTVVVTGTCGNVISSAATLTVNAATSITTQPASQTICSGSSVTFSVVAAGTAPLTYQWKKAGTDIPGATTSTYTIASVSSSDAGSYTVVVTGTCGNVTSNVATLTVNAVTAITTQPVSQTICTGSPVTFSVVAAGVGLTYQWKKDGVDISGATSATYTIPSAASSNAGSYTVVLTGTCGNVTSSAATLTVNAATSISTQPVSQTICSGSSVTFSVVANGTALLTYQWKKNGTDISGATSASYTIPAVGSSDAGNYTVLVTGTCGNITSNVATLTVNTAPAITSQPVNQTVCPGGNATFSVTATGAGLTYKWQKAGVDIPGATNSSYTISPVLASDAGSYTVIISGTCTPSVTSNAAILTVNTATSISTQPVSQTLCAGSSATFSVVAAGTAPFTYQWKKNGTDISGAVSSSYTISSISSSDAGSYTVVVTGTCGSATSTAATLTVNAATGIAVQPLSQAICLGSPVTFSVTAGGTAPFTYQWKKNGTDISGATLSSYSIPSVSNGDAGSYTVTVSGICGNVTSTAANLTVNAVTGVITQPLPQTVCSGAPVTFSVTAGGTGPFTYQWKKNGTDISGATSSSYTISSVANGDAGSYTVVVSGTCGNATSNAAILTVNPATAITSQPVAQTVCLGSSASFSVVVSGTAPFTYQWQKDGVNISGATSSSYSISAVSASDAGSYTVLINGACGNVSSTAAILAVNALTTITTQPGPQTVCSGSSASFNVVATGTSVTYQWYKNGNLISGATAASYNISSVAAADAGAYTVVVSGTCGNVTSNAATLTVNPLPVPSLTGPSEVCNGIFGNVYQTDAGMTNYVWTISSGGTKTSGGGSSDNIVGVTWSGTVSQTISVTYTDANGCSPLQPTQVFVNITQPTLVNAGPNDTICYDSPYTVSGASVQNYSSFQWKALGDGTFENGSSSISDVLKPTYTAGDNDKLKGFADLVLSANGNGACGINTDTLRLIIPAKLQAAIGAPKPFDINSSTKIQVTIKTYGHQNIQDLGYYLIAPDGKTFVTLKDAPTNQSKTYNRGYDANLVFDSQHTPITDTLKISGLPKGLGQYSLQGTYAATGDWSILYNKFNPADGGWAVAVRDNINLIGASQGQIVEANITFTSNTGKVVSFTSGNINIAINNPSTTPYYETTYMVPIGLKTKCSNSCDAAAVVSVIGGVGPYKYQWSDASLPATDSVGLCKGTYSVQVTDAIGCVTTASVTVTAPDPIVVDSIKFSNGNPLKCHGDTTSIRVYAKGGTGTLKVTLKGVDKNLGEYFSQLKAGSDTLHIFDSNGCSKDTIITISEPDVIAITDSSKKDITCYHANNGEIHITAKGGNLLKYQLYNNASKAVILENKTNPDFIGLSKGLYRVIVSDSIYGCQADTCGIIEIKEPDSLKFTSVSKDITCFGLKNGTISLNVSGGTAPYYYSIDGTNWNKGGSITGLDAGNYTISVMDSLGCMAVSVKDTITSPDQIVIDRTQWKTIDAKDCSTNPGKIIVEGSYLNNLSKSSASLQYSVDLKKWQSSDTLVVYGGKYTVYVRDTLANKGCYASDTITVTGPHITITSMIVTPPTCYGGSDGSIILNAVGADPITYVMNGKLAKDTMKNLSAGDYHYTLTDAMSCVAYFDTTLNKAQMTFVISDTTFNSTANSGSFTVVVNNSQGGYKLKLEKQIAQKEFTAYPDPTKTTDTPPKYVYSGLPYGVYRLSATDTVYGCQRDTMFFFGEIDTLKVPSITIKGADCHGSYGMFIYNAPSATPPVTVWAYEKTTYASYYTPNLKTQDSVALPAGKYHVVIFDNIGRNWISDTIVINEPAPVYFRGVVDDPKCLNSSNSTDTLGHIYQYPIGLDKTKSVDYSWNKQKTYTYLDNGVVVTKTVDTPLTSVRDTVENSAGVYTLKITNGVCEYDTTYRLNSKISLNVAISPDTIIGCIGTIDSLRCIATTSSDDKLFHYAWYPKNYLSNDTVANPKVTISYQSVGVYTVKVTNSGCYDIGYQTLAHHKVYDVQIGYYNLPSTIQEYPDTVKTRKGNELIFDAYPPVSFVHYSWIPTGDTVPAITYRPEHSGSLILTVLTSDGCVELDSVYIKFPGAVNPPSGFSPNGDGINDKWVIDNLGDYPNAMVEVFNRWGSLVFKSKGYDNVTPGKVFDGTRNGRPLPVGTYYYIIKLNDGYEPQTGTVTIMR